MQQNQRLYHLDWLRVAAISLLIFYHTAMVYVPEWGFHFKHETSILELQNLMLLVSPWRMGLLWFISGVALRFMWIKYRMVELLWLRSRIILLSLLIGILFIVPPQLYVEMKQSSNLLLGFTDFLYAFYVEPKDHFQEYQSGVWPHIDVNHLWFLRSLWLFNLILILCSPALLSEKFQVYIDTGLRSKYVLIMTCVTTVLCIDIWGEGEQKREVYGFVLLLLGFLVGKKVEFWMLLKKHWQVLVLVALVSLIALQFAFELIWKPNMHQHIVWANIIVVLVFACAKVLPVFAVLAVSAQFLNRRSDTVAQFNQWVFPIYVIHQTIIVVIAYNVASFNIPIIWDAIITLFLTILACLLSIFLMRKNTFLRILCGGRGQYSAHWSSSKFWKWLVTISCAPLAIELVF